MKKIVATALPLLLAIGVPTLAQHAPSPEQHSLFQGNDEGRFDLDIPEGTTLEQTLELLKKTVPNFQYVVRHGNWEHLKVPSMHLRHYKLDSVLSVLEGLYPQSFHAADIAQGAASLYLISPTGSTLEDNSMSAPVTVQVFSLSSAIDRQVSLDGARGLHGTTTEARKRAMQAVLSLIENVLKQNTSSIPIPDLSIHDETETLVVKGEPSRVAEVERALKALDAPVDQAQLRSLQSANDALQRYLDRARQEIVELKTAAQSGHKN